MKRRPSTPTELAAYRAQLSANVAITAINSRQKPDGISLELWALYNIAQAIKDLATVHYDPNGK